MPELPEVETVRRSLEPLVPHKQITAVEIFKLWGMRRPLLHWLARKLGKLTGGVNICCFQCKQRSRFVGWYTCA